MATEMVELEGAAGGDAAVIVETAERAAGATPAERGGLFLAAHAQEIVDLERFADEPRSKRGQVCLHTGPSLAAYVTLHKGSGSMLYADVEARQIVAVLNDHDPEGPGWCDHRAALQLRHTPEWDHWASLDGKLVTQVDFAHHIERGLAEIENPEAAEMLELAQSFEASSSAQFRSATRLDSGERQFTYQETIQARAGQTGQLTIPETFTLGVAPFEGSPKYAVIARLRYRLREGTLTIGYELDRPEDVIRAAFSDVLTDVEAGTDLHALRGVAPAPLR